MLSIDFIEILREVTLDIVGQMLAGDTLCVMLLAWAANLIGLATIIGAFTAGVILYDGYFRDCGDVEEHRLRIRDLIAPLETIRVAIIGKLVAGPGASRNKNRLATGLGMMPRGEVGLIFSGQGPRGTRRQPVLIHCHHDCRNHGGDTAAAEVCPAAARGRGRRRRRVRLRG